MSTNQADTYTTFMMDHATGAHTPAMMLAGDLHRLLSDHGGQAADLWDTLGGALLESVGIDVDLPPITKRKVADEVPETAEDILAISDAGIDWKRGWVTGIGYFNTRTPHTKFMKLEPGKAAPKHGHSALEATIVLQGRFTDGHGVYERGDIVIGEPGMRHKPAAYGDEACICFVAESPKKFWRLF
jgi:putative transcriptional regulator